jgi:hypothetical protein
MATFISSQWWWSLRPPPERNSSGAFHEAETATMANQKGQKAGTQRGNRQRFPYEPRVIGGKMMMPAELQAIHRYVVETPVLENVTEEIRAVIETVWPELISKLPQKA